MHFLPNQDLSHTTARTVTASAWPNGLLFSYQHSQQRKLPKKLSIVKKNNERENTFANVKVCANKLEEMLVMILVINGLEN